MSYSLGESFTSASRTRTMRRTRSTERSPLRKTGRSPCCCSRWRSAARMRASELVHAERLGHVVVGAEIERLDLAGLVVAAGQHHDRHGRAALAQRADQVLPVRCPAGRGRGSPGRAPRRRARPSACAAGRRPRRRGSPARARPVRRKRRIGGSSSTTRMSHRARSCRRLQPGGTAPGPGRVMVNTAPERSAAVARPRSCRPWPRRSRGRSARPEAGAGAHAGRPSATR